MMVWFAWRWKGRYYKSNPTRRMQFGYGTLRRIYYRWKHGGRTPDALALHYWAPVKIPPELALDFAQTCISSDARSFAEAYGRLPEPLATVYGYRLALGATLRGRIVRLFAARRLVDVRTRKARAAVKGFSACGKGDKSR
jgi:hypothetical protein